MIQRSSSIFSVRSSANPSLGRFFSQAADKSTIVVFGGSGYVGSHIVDAALKMGVDVLSVSRSGKPSAKASGKAVAASCIHKGEVTWIAADATNPDSLIGALQGKTIYGAVSCIGAFGSNAYMEKVNGDLNISLMSATLSAGIPRFVYVSTVENNLPDFLLKGYFNGKRRAEQALLDAYPDTGVILRPSFVYGTRSVILPSNPLKADSLELPLWILGKPMEILFSSPPIRTLRSKLPGMQAILAPPIAVEALGKVAAAAATGYFEEEISESTPSEQGEQEQKRVSKKVRTNIMTVNEIVAAARSLQ